MNKLSAYNKFSLLVIIGGSLFIFLLPIAFGADLCFPFEGNELLTRIKPQPPVQGNCPAPGKFGEVTITEWRQLDERATLKEVSFDINKVPDFFKNQYFVTQRTGDACPTGSEKDIFGITIPKESAVLVKTKINLGDGLYMEACAAQKSQREQLLQEIQQQQKTDFRKIDTGYKTSIQIPCQPIAGGSCPDINTPAGYIARIYQFSLMIAGLVAFGSIIFGAIQYILSAGSIVNQGEAKDRITQAIVGLLLLLGAYLILYTINPDLVKLRNPSREIISIEKQGDVFVGGGTEQTIGEISPIEGCKIHNILQGEITTREGTTQVVGGCLICKEGFNKQNGECVPNDLSPKNPGYVEPALPKP